MRGSMFLIDRGLAALEIKQLLETRENTKYSNSALARELKLIGWSLDDRTLGLAIYSAVNLLPHIPKALWAGLGQDSVQKLRKLVEDCSVFWMNLPEHKEDQETSKWNLTCYGKPFFR